MEFPLSAFGKGSRSSVYLAGVFKKLGCCVLFSFRNTISDDAFTQAGFRDWKHALGKKGILTNHSSGKVHTESMSVWKEYQRRLETRQSIGEQLDRMGSQIIDSM